MDGWNIKKTHGVSVSLWWRERNCSRGGEQILLDCLLLGALGGLLRGLQGFTDCNSAAMADELWQIAVKSVVRESCMLQIFQRGGVLELCFLGHADKLLDVVPFSFEQRGVVRDGVVGALLFLL